MTDALVVVVILLVGSMAIAAVRCKALDTVVAIMLTATTNVAVIYAADTNQPVVALIATMSAGTIVAALMRSYPAKE